MPEPHIAAAMWGSVSTGTTRVPSSPRAGLGPAGEVRAR